MRTRETKPMKTSRVAQDLGDFHNGPGCNVIAVSGVGGNGVKLFCTCCKILVDAQALGCGISITDAISATDDGKQ